MAKYIVEMEDPSGETFTLKLNAKSLGHAEEIAIKHNNQCEITDSYEDITSIKEKFEKRKED